MPDLSLSALILAGGRSARMGQDKAWLVFAGQPLLDRVARRVLPLVNELIISTNHPELFDALTSALPCPVHLVTDRYPDVGPLAGLHAGLSAATNDLVLTLAVDMPFVNVDLLRHIATLAEGYDAVVPLVPSPRTKKAEPEPLHALYRRSCLPAIERHLAAGRHRLVSFLADVRVREVRPPEIARFDPGFRSFWNINTPEEWEQAIRLTTSTDRL
jgi:molybdopterin-guanine dinucleotide biosynthesis protein A